MVIRPEDAGGDWEATTLEVARRASFRVKGPPGAQVVLGEGAQAQRVKLGRSGRTAMSAVVRPGRYVRAHVTHGSSGYRRTEEFGVPDRLQVWGVVTGSREPRVHAVVFRDATGWVKSAQVVLQGHDGSRLGRLKPGPRGMYSGPLPREKHPLRLVATAAGSSTAEMELPHPQTLSQHGAATSPAEPWAFRFGVAAGVEVTTDGVSMPALDGGARYAFWLAPRHGVAVGLHLGARWVSFPSGKSGIIKRDQAWLMPVEASLYYVYSVAPGWGLQAGLGTGPLFHWRDSHRENPARAWSESTSDTGWAFSLGLGATYTLGPGQVLLQARFAPEVMAPPSFLGAATRLGITLGYAGIL